MSLIKLKDVNKCYKEQVIYDNIDFEIIKEVGIVGIRGRRGSGKTTLINMLLGYDKDYTGDIEVLGKDIKSLGKRKWKYYLRNEVSVVYKDYGLYENLSVIENLNLVANRGASLEYLEMFKIAQIKDIKVRKISEEQKQKVAIIRAILKEPKILILDEPLARLDDEQLDDLLEILNVLKNDMLILICTYDSRVEKCTNEIYKIKYRKIEKEENKKLKGEVERNSKEVKIKEELNSKISIWDKFRQSSFNIARLITKEHRKKFLVRTLIMTLILSIVVILYLALLSFMYVGSSYEYPLDDRIVIMDRTSLKKKYEYKGEKYLTPRDKYYWSEEDKEKLEAIDGVKKVEFMTYSISAGLDEEDNELNIQINPDNYPEVVKSKASHFFNKSFTIRFKSISEPYDVIPHYKTRDVLQIHLLVGDYPRDGTQEILIPDIVADQLIRNDIGSSYEDLVGKDIDLKVSKYKEEEKFNKTYEISGVYATGYQFYLRDEYFVYVPCQPRAPDFMEMAAKDYRHERDKVGDDDYYAPMYESYEAYQKANGVYEDQVVIILEDDYTSEDVYDEISELYPNYKQKSKYAYEQKHRGVEVNDTWIGINIYGLILLYIGGVYFLFSQIKYYKNKKKDHIIILSLGYAKWKVIRTLVVEVLMDMIALFIGILIFLILIHLIPYVDMYLSTNIGKGLERMFIIIVVSIILIVNIINLIFAMLDIGYKSVIKYFK